MRIFGNLQSETSLGRGIRTLNVELQVHRVHPRTSAYLAMIGRRMDT